MNPSPHASDVHGKIAAYYTRKLAEHGPTARGVDWNSEESQLTRFDQIAKLLPTDRPFSVLDYGCGYGAFADYLRLKGYAAQYRGFDVSQAMIEAARTTHARQVDLSFTAISGELGPADYVVASGIFSVKMDVSLVDWEAYVYSTIARMAELATFGFAFNLLTAYSDADRMRADLYYADPHRYFDLCRTQYSRWVALLHDYGLYEFTILTRR
jgi:SAM-dependent methyltransferase